MRRRAVLLAAALAACQGQGGPQLGPLGADTQPLIPNETGVGARATFVLTTAAGLLGAAADGKILGRIADLPPGSSPSGGALHPGGTSFYFALSQTTLTTGFGSDIYRVNLDGTDLRPVLERDHANVFYASPTFDTKGNLYVHRREGDVSGANLADFAKLKDSIERVDAATGQTQTILTDAADPTVAPAGTQIIYMKMDRGETTDLWIAAADGSKPQKFLKTSDSFAFLQAPRFSPDGRAVVWSSVPPIVKKSSSPALVSAAMVVRVGGKLAHLDIPSELYIAPVDGSSIRSIGRTVDDVVPAWSPDATRVAYIAKATFFIRSVADGAVITKTPSIAVGYGELTWLRSN